MKKLGITIEPEFTAGTTTIMSGLLLKSLNRVDGIMKVATAGRRPSHPEICDLCKLCEACEECEGCESCDSGLCEGTQA